jgi:hypothetical protein
MSWRTTIYVNISLIDTWMVENNWFNNIIFTKNFERLNGNRDEAHARARCVLLEIQCPHLSRGFFLPFS